MKHIILQDAIGQARHAAQLADQNASTSAVLADRADADAATHATIAGQMRRQGDPELAQAHDTATAAIRRIAAILDGQATHARISATRLREAAADAEEIAAAL